MQSTTTYPIVKSPERLKNILTSPIPETDPPFILFPHMMVVFDELKPFAIEGLKTHSTLTKILRGKLGMRPELLDAIRDLISYKLQVHGLDPRVGEWVIGEYTGAITGNPAVKFYNADELDAREVCFRALSFLGGLTPGGAKAIASNPLSARAAKDFFEAALSLTNAGCIAALNEYIMRTTPAADESDITTAEATGGLYFSTTPSARKYINAGQALMNIEGFDAASLEAVARTACRKELHFGQALNVLAK